MATGNDANQQNTAPVDKDTEEVAKRSGQLDEMDNPIDAGEAQNVTDGAERLSGEEAEQATRKANEGARQDGGGSV
jgi:hypothetical protein